MKTSIYTEELGNEICEAIANSEQGLAQICTMHDFPSPRTIYKWLNCYPNFKNSYLTARQIQADMLRDQILDIADHLRLGTKTNISTQEMTAHRRLQIETRKWLATNLLPRKHGKEQEAQDSAEEAPRTRYVIKKSDGTELEI